MCARDFEILESGYHSHLAGALSRVDRSRGFREEGYSGRCVKGKSENWGVKNWGKRKSPRVRRAWLC